jgi:hypothetical protein
LSRSRRSAESGRVDGQGAASGDRTVGVGAAAQVVQLQVAPGAAVLEELRAVRQLLEGIERHLLGESRSSPSQKAPAVQLSDDAIVDQRSASVPRDLYLRLARAGAFPSRKIGKRICARWGDVRAAFLDRPGVRKTKNGPEDNTSGTDGLDRLRRQLGLAEQGK